MANGLEATFPLVNRCQQILQAAQDAGLVDQSTDDSVEELLAVDSTIVRAHQHAAGARKDSATWEVSSQPTTDTGGAH